MSAARGDWTSTVVTYTSTADDVTPGQPQFAPAPGIPSDSSTLRIKEGGDGCSGRSLDEGETCTITVEGMTRVLGHQAMSLVLPDGSADPSTTVVSIWGRRAGGGYLKQVPERIYDSRAGAGPIGPRQSRAIYIGSGRGGYNVPAILNVTVVGATESSFVTVHTSGQPRPNTSLMTFPKGFTGANMITVKLGADGKFVVYNNAGKVHILVDMLGRFERPDVDESDGVQLLPTAPTRAYDSRTDKGLRGPFGNGGINFSYDFGSKERNTRIFAVVVNVAAVGPTGTGYLSALSSPADRPRTSTVNYTRGRTSANSAVVTVLHGGDQDRPRFAVQNYATSGRTHIIVDILGWFERATPEGLVYVSAPPTRVLDTRNNVGSPGALGVNTNRSVTVPPSMVTPSTRLLSGNLTGVLASDSTYLTAWDGVGARPGISNLNLGRNETRSNAALVPVRGTDIFDIFNRNGRTNAIFDMNGRFDCDYWCLEESGDAHRKASRQPTQTITPARP